MAAPASTPCSLRALTPQALGPVASWPTPFISYVYDLYDFFTTLRVCLFVLWLIWRFWWRPHGSRTAPAAPAAPAALAAPAASAPASAEPKVLLDGLACLILEAVERVEHKVDGLPARLGGRVYYTAPSGLKLHASIGCAQLAKTAEPTALAVPDDVEAFLIRTQAVCSRCGDEGPQGAK